MRHADVTGNEGMSSDLSFIHRFEPGGTGNTLLLLHGTGGNEHDLIPLGQAVAPGWALLSPRGKVLEQGMPRFFRRLAEGVFDEADVKARAAELADFVAAAADHYGFDSRRVIALGYSNGANIASAVMLVRPESLAAAALLRPMVTFKPDIRADLGGKFVLIVSGQFDPIAPPGHAARLETIFDERGAKVTRQTLPASHGLSQADLSLVSEWLAGIQGSLGAGGVL